MTRDKILFVSDLDGTLLAPDATLPDDAAARINALTASGVQITYATARTVRSVKHILGSIDFTNAGACPVALMNGVLVRDMRAGCYVRAALLDRAAAMRIHDAVTADGRLAPFVYTLDATPIDGDPLVTHYHHIANEAMEAFMRERVERYGKPFLRFETIDAVTGDIVYFAVMGDEDAIRAAAGRVDAIDGVRYTYYRDSYRRDMWYLEIFDAAASKKHAIEFLRTYTGAESVVCFGDNCNDLPMFASADVAVAVANAVDEVKAAADYITDDVVGFMETYLEKKEAELC